MREFILELDYDTKVIRNLRGVWLQPMVMQPGWMLCYEDELYERGIIYRSRDKKLLEKLKTKMMDAYKAGKNEVRI